jgi:hypothetical protein
MPYFQVLAVTGGTGPHWWSGSGLPAGLSMNPATGVISGVPETDGKTLPQLEVTDSSGPVLTATASFLLAVQDPQPVAGLSATSVSPINGSGSAQTFTAQYTHPNGASDLQVVYLDFGISLFGSNSCVATYVPASNGLYLFNDSNTALLGPVTPGTNATLSNSQCTLSGAGGAATAAGNTLTVPFAIVFTGDSFFRRLYVSGLAQSNSGALGAWLTFGAWTP